MDNCEESEKANSREKVREFCKAMMANENIKEKPIYVLATLVDINKLDGKYTEESLNVSYLYEIKTYV